MLSSRARLAARQGQHAPARHEFLQQLVDEYQRSVHVLRKEEIVANLANFAYDPINYATLAQLQVMDLFLDILDADHEGAARASPEHNSTDSLPSSSATAITPTMRLQQQRLASFALGGICNCIADPVLQESFIAGDGFPLVEPYIWSIEDAAEPLTGARYATRLNTLVSALAIAFFLLDSRAFAAVTHERLRNHIQSLEMHTHAQIANVASAFRTRFEELTTAVEAAPPLPPLPPLPPMST